MAIGFTTLLLPGTHCVSNHGSLVCSQNSTGSSAKHGCCTANMLCLKMMHYFTPKMWQIYLGKWWTAAGLQGISVFPRKFSNKPTPTTQHKTKDLVANSGVIQVGTGLGQQVATALPQMHASCSSFEKSRARKVGKWPEKRKKHVQTLRNIHEKPKYFHHSIKRNPYIINVCIIYHYIYIYTRFFHIVNNRLTPPTQRNLLGPKHLPNQRPLRWQNGFGLVDSPSDSHMARFFLYILYKSVQYF